MPRTPELMLAGRAAQFLGVGRNTLSRWNRSGTGPPRTLKGKRYWYSREALKEWLKTGAAAVRELLPASGLRHGPASWPSASSESLLEDPPRRFR